MPQATSNISTSLHWTIFSTPSFSRKQCAHTWDVMITWSEARARASLRYYKSWKRGKQKRKSSESFEPLSIVALLHSKYVQYIAPVILSCTYRTAVTDVIFKCPSALRWNFFSFFTTSPLLSNISSFFWCWLSVVDSKVLIEFAPRFFLFSIYVFGDVKKRWARWGGGHTRKQNNIVLYNESGPLAENLFHSQNVLFVVKNVEICIIHMQQQTSREAHKLRGELVFLWTFPR